MRSRYLLAAILAAGLANAGFAHAETTSPVFGRAAIQVTTPAENREVVGKGYYADYYGYYGNYYSAVAYAYGNAAYSYKYATYYAYAYTYAAAATSAYYYAYVYQYYGR